MACAPAPLCGYSRSIWNCPMIVRMTSFALPTT